MCQRLTENYLAPLGFGIKAKRLEAARGRTPIATDSLHPTGQNGGIITSTPWQRPARTATAQTDNPGKIGTFRRGAVVKTF
jgi:hypothetical protein